MLASGPLPLASLASCRHRSACPGGRGRGRGGSSKGAWRLRHLLVPPAPAGRRAARGAGIPLDEGPVGRCGQGDRWTPGKGTGEVVSLGGRGQPRAEDEVHRATRWFPVQAFSRPRCVYTGETNHPRFIPPEYPGRHSHLGAVRKKRLPFFHFNSLRPAAPCSRARGTSTEPQEKHLGRGTIQALM